MPDLRGALTRQLGPLPVWGWAVVAGGGYLVMRYLTDDGAGDGGVVLGTITDADPGIGDGGGATQTPVGNGSTGTVGGNGVSRTVLTTTKKTAFYQTGWLGKIAGYIQPDKKWVVQETTINGKKFWRIMGALGPNNTVIRDTSRLGALIKYDPTPNTYKISKTTPTQAG